MERERTFNRGLSQNRLTDKNIVFRVVKPLVVEKVRQTRLVFDRLINDF